MANKVPVLEVFGPTFQGEGMVIGKKTMFVRTAGCDYSCAWCDSAFTWDGSAKEDIRMLSAKEVFAELQELAPNNFAHVTISGGNPALLKNMGELVTLLHDKGMEVAIETQGSRWQDWLVEIDDLTISPKPPSSSMVTDFTVLDDLINRLRDADRVSHTSLKVVCFNEEDYQYAKEIHARYPDIAFFLQVGNEDVDHNVSEDNLVPKLLMKYEELVDRTMSDSDMTRVRVLPQLHTLVWGNKRGV
ncbi:7-carboxy-7-deazaguanine synthase QueE [Paenalkalicoccus suaedae]|uniref:7-carboxy-7-deazaguanine synthase n=1 Tax=Paenalkalicoccus suaedae TaxID=2592382 RepID=A0A859FEV1_9BACI|nr:7-carboxy-7-deazaguanine synthase QueE [Paenalkalicoccus suaedae]QKS71617.1 7-carboxy-7-deazaguanine synthase QueE [Paenalkalicoccus suaedae]